MISNLHVQAVILAAGKGTRMNSLKAKILYKVGGKPILLHSLALCRNLTSHPPIVVINGKSKAVRKLIKIAKAIPVIENSPQGTGSSVRMALPHLSSSVSHILVVNSDDSFLYRLSSIREMLRRHIDNHHHLTFLTTIPKQNYTNVNRKVVRDNSGKFIDLQPSESTNEVVCGAYVFDVSWLKSHVPLVKINPQKNEYFITDLLLIALEKRSRVSPYVLKDPNEWWGVNTKEDLKYARKLWRQLHEP